MLVLLSSIAGLLCLADIFIKQDIENNVKSQDEHTILNDKVTVRKVHNHGFIMNLKDDNPELVLGIAAVTTLLLGIYEAVLWCRKGHFRQKIGGAMILGGALSNLYDRLIRGYVVDYLALNVKFKKVARVTCNLADIFIFIGSLLSIPGSGKKK